MGRSIAYISSGSKNRVDLELYIKLQEQVWDVLKKKFNANSNIEYNPDECQIGHMPI